MRRQIRVWVIVMDGGHVQLFVPDEELEGLHALPALVVAEPHAYARDLKSDRPGRSFGSTHTRTRHAIEPRHDYHKQEKHDSAARAASALERAFVAHEFDRLVLVAPPRTVGEMRTLLSGRLQAETDIIPKDLSKAAPPEIWQEVASIVPRPWLRHAS
jgi:protein required for attachment to host cells